jgi:predicted transcriptional regulator
MISESEIEKSAREASIVMGSQVTRRSRMETTCDILHVIESGVEKPTHIMYKANLSWAVMQGYLKSLEDQGLIFLNMEQGKHLYRLSDKGKHLLSEFQEVQEKLNIKV